MKKKIIALFLVLIGLLGLASCGGKTEYTVELKEFYYSYDNGSQYGNERVELEVGKTILMKVRIQVTTNKKEKDEVSGSLSIPNINVIDSYYIRGQKITPTIDSISNTTTYPFTISTNEIWEFVFEFSPAAEARVQMELNFNDPVPSIYNSVYTIKFVKPANTNSEASI